MEDDNDSIENVRREEEVDDSKADESDLEVPFPDDDEANKQEPDDFDMPQPDNNDDEEEDEPVDAPAMDIDSVASSVEQTGNDGDLDLGLVNDMGIDSDDEERQAAGEEASSTAKWHKHTVRVFKHLKKCMKDPDQVVDADVEAADLPEQVQFHEITKNVRTRRNAASVFFEILQLKTWDFIEVDQQEPYGEINISPGVRFGEDVPN
jgi:cohesin complex subunit SCC1